MSNGRSSEAKVPGTKERNIARIFEACYLKGSELAVGDPSRKYKGRTVFEGNRVVDENSEQAMFAELGSSPASMETWVRLPRRSWWSIANITILANPAGSYYMLPPIYNQFMEKLLDESLSKHKLLRKKESTFLVSRQDRLDNYHMMDSIENRKTST